MKAAKGNVRKNWSREKGIRNRQLKSRESDSLEDAPPEKPKNGHDAF